ncbi:phosphate ABC transporter substrate-binding protein PstS [Catellatospora citrea]|nr:phosphate ABC transporter substrate-binding protein PstS [Catellatospora citrea]
MISRRRRWSARLLAAVLVMASVPITAAPAHAVAYVPISGAGSTWSGPAIIQWASNVTQYDMTVNYQAQGSSDGRNRFKAGTVDFGVSEIPYGLTDGGVTDLPPRRKFAYMPIVAGGTAFMYNLTIGDHRVTNLRLSGETIAKIFTGVITRWDDKQIKADNPRLTLPGRKIVPVVRSDGSGTTAQFTLWLSATYPELWNAYCRKAGRNSSPCGFTSDFPVVSGSGFVAQAGSDQVSGYTKNNVATITYVEYSYAKNANFPVAKMRNAAGYFIEPTAYSVAVALTEARIKSDLTQDLTRVYGNSDKRTYPLSSYSYMIIPVDEIPPGFSLEKGRSLSDFAYYFLCEGQRQAEDLGYSPLPVNLVTAAKQQVDRIKGAVPQAIDGRSCNNPTLTANGKNALAEKAPNPKECDLASRGDQCASGTGGARADTPLNPLPGSSGGATPSGGASAGPGGGTGDGDGTGTGTGDGTGSGQGAGGPGDGDGGQSDVYAVTVDLAAADRSQQRLFLLLAAAMLVAVVLLPPLVGRALRRRSAR